MNTSSETTSVPKVNGLILAGGYSSRMGTDKIMLEYHGMPQYQYLAHAFSGHAQKVFISCRSDQHFDFAIPCIADQYSDIGPLAGVLSAFLSDPSSAWLVIACDLPFVDADSISFLLANRDVQKEATYFIQPDTSFPEPLLTLYEPAIYTSLLAAYHAGQSSLNRILQQCHGNGVLPADPKILRSANTREEMEALKNKL